MLDKRDLDSATELVVVSPLVHYRHRGRLYAYAGYAREIDVWAELVRRVIIVAPCRDEPPAADRHMPAEHARVALEAPLPIVVADDQIRVAPWDAVFRTRKDAP